MKSNGVRGAYHTALAGGGTGAPSAAEPVSRWDHVPSGSFAVVHDVFLELPPEFDACDAFYSDPPWRPGVPGLHGVRDLGSVVSASPGRVGVRFSAIPPKRIPSRPHSR